MRFRPTKALCLHALICLLSLEVARPDSVAAEDVAACITSYEQYLRALHTLSFDFEVSTHESGGGIGPRERLIGVSRGSAGVRGVEFRFRERQRYLIWNGGKFDRHDSDKEEVRTATTRLHLQANYPVTGESFELTDFPESGAVFSPIEPSDKSQITFEQLNLATYALYGSLPYDGGQDLVSILRSGPDPEVAPEEIDGHPVRRITSRTAHGTYRVWLDPAFEYAPRRIEVRKARDSRYLDRTLEEFPPPAAPGDRHPHERMREYRFEVDKVALVAAPGGGHPAITGFEVRERRIYESGASFLQRNAVKFSNVRFECVDRDLKPVMDVPDGTRFQFQDAPSLRAEWRDGAVVKLVDRAALNRLQGLDVPDGGGARWRTWLLVATNVVLVLALLIGWLYRRGRADARP